MTGLICALILTAAGFGADFTLGVSGPGNVLFDNQYAPGSSITIVYNGTPPAGAYQWFHNDAVIAGATATTLPLASLVSTDSGNYSLTITANGATTTSSPLTINVLPYPPSPIDTTFVAQLHVPQPGDNITNPLFVFPDESVLVLEASALYPQPTVRLNADGSRDTTFTFPATAGAFLAGLPDKSIITSLPPYRLNPDGSAHVLPLPAGFDSTQALTAAARQADGKLLVAQGIHIARINLDDSVDSSFTYSSAPATPYHVVRAFTFDATGRIYVTATTVVTAPPSQPSRVIFRLAANGTEDAGFTPVSSGFDMPVAIYPLVDGRLLVFTSPGGLEISVLNDNGTTNSSWTPTVFPGIPASYAVDSAGLRVFTLGNGILKRWAITSTSLVEDPTFYQGSAYSEYLLLAPSGKLFISGSFTERDGIPAAGLVRLRTTDVVPTLPPNAYINPNGFAIPVGGSPYTFHSIVTGTGPFTYQWLALDHQTLPADTTSPDLVIPDFEATNLGRYQLRVTTAYGSVLTPVSEAVLSTGQIFLPYLANLSGRAYVGTGDDTAIVGFATKSYDGSPAVPALLRGAGPALINYGVTAPLPNPVLNLYRASGQLLTSNDDWGSNANLTDLQAAVTATGAFPFPANSKDAALLSTFNPGTSFTAQLVDHDGASGIGLIEIYRTSSFTASEFINLSLRARTGPGEKVATAGFVIVDPQNFGRSVKLLLRVVGPTLAQSGVASPLADPVLTLYKSSGEVVATNDNWSDNANAADLATATKQVGAFDLPSGSKDAALLIDLPAGVYSIQATGTGSSTGVALTEIYLVR